jgi:hypothetical protein
MRVSKCIGFRSLNNEAAYYQYGILRNTKNIFKLSPLKYTDKCYVRETYNILLLQDLGYIIVAQCMARRYSYDSHVQ